jgi:hypothetical protein
MIPILRTVYRMSRQTKFVSYKPGPPENMFLDQRDVQVIEASYTGAGE